MKKLSIGLRLTLSYLLVFAVAQLIFGVGMWVILRHNLYDIADDTLEGQIDDARHFLEAQHKDASVAKLQEEVGETYILEHSGDYLQIREEQGAWIYRASFLEKNNASIATSQELQSPLYEDRKIAGRRFRFLSEIVEVNGRRFIVQTGIPEGDILRTLHYFRQNLFSSALVVLLVASGVGFWLSRRALAPVDAITHTARSINAANLNSRLEKLDTGDELQRLSDTLNEMLSRIENAFQRVSQFTADASHELRTPISLMRTEAEIALRKSRDESEYQEALRHILGEAERTSTLIEKLLSLARADAGRESLDIHPLNLRETVQKVIKEWRQVINDHRLNITQDIADQDLFIAGDRAALVRLTNILLDNAVKYTPAGGNIEVALQPSDGNAVFTIKDTGIGISDDDQPRIFERFYRADKARSRELGGAGLGLAIAHWIVEQHGGSIRVRSSLGSGSQFVVLFPLHAGPNSNEF
ncbi:MAG TPA: heavy metal sensor histidine kinase [Terriglobales bacterium]|nr:heavy metal sensor histidine kinase [Terriglobales bacterium]